MLGVGALAGMEFAVLCGCSRSAVFLTQPVRPSSTSASICACAHMSPKQIDAQSQYRVPRKSGSSLEPLTRSSDRRKGFQSQRRTIVPRTARHAKPGQLLVAPRSLALTNSVWIRANCETTLEATAKGATVT